MCVSARSKALAFRLALVCAAALAAAPPREARAQEQKAPGARLVAEKIDEFGRLGHCDRTARLDNLAVELQNDPGSRAYLVGYDPARREGRHVESYLRVAAAYLVMARGIDDARVVMRHGGRSDTDEVKTELWVVPEGAHLPLDTKPLGGFEEGKEFSGLLEKYQTVDGLHGTVDEMGALTAEDVSQYNFARALKKQPASQGYLVVYTAADALPGAWRRIARREKQAILSRAELNDGRIRLVNGGAAAETGVELWVQPEGAPPPVAEAREQKSLSAAFMLYDFGHTLWITEEDEERRLLANLADLLRMDARARLSLIIHPPTPDEEEETATGPEPAPAAGAAAPAPAAEDSAAAGAAPEEEDYRQKTLRWREGLAGKYGIAPERVVVTVGRKNSANVESLEVWVVPADAPMPDAFAPEPEDEPEPTPEDEEVEPPPAV